MTSENLPSMGPQLKVLEQVTILKIMVADNSALRLLQGHPLAMTTACS